jgi:hypothetical protein
MRQTRLAGFALVVGVAVAVLGALLLTGLSGLTAMLLTRFLLVLLVLLLGIPLRAALVLLLVAGHSLILSRSRRTFAA